MCWCASTPGRPRASFNPCVSSRKPPWRCSPSTTSTSTSGIESSPWRSPSGPPPWLSDWAAWCPGAWTASGRPWLTWRRATWKRQCAFRRCAASTAWPRRWRTCARHSGADSRRSSNTSTSRNSCALPEPCARCFSRTPPGAPWATSKSYRTRCSTRQPTGSGWSGKDTPAGCCWAWAACRARGWASRC